MKLKRVFFCLTFLLSLIVVPSSFAAASKIELKAVYLYNFINFITWPNNKFSSRGAPYQICLLGNDGVLNPLRKVVRNEQVNGRSIRVKRLSGVEGLRNCHIAYVANKNLQKNVINLAQGNSVLTVAESKNFIANGGIINFRNRGAKLQLDINLKVAKRNGLKISSKLLRLANVV